MNPERIYEYLVKARARVLDGTRPHAESHWQVPFPTWAMSLGETLTHVMICEGYYVLRMRGEEVPPYDEWPIRQEQPPDLSVLEAAWTEQAAKTRATLREVDDWHRALEYPVTDDDGSPLRIVTSPGDLFTQLFQHEVHHRSQVMNMLKQLGVAVGDVDFNALMFERRPA
ncbi:MAG: DinB family protein [bacterium]